MLQFQQYFTTKESPIMTTSPTVSIVDCGVGNHRSVFNALHLLNVEAEITSDPDTIASSTHIIFPGVGSFHEGMEGLQERGLIEILTEEVMEKKKRILGICLGMQLFASEGLEHGNIEGLNFIPGKVVKIETEHRLPHIGWNNVSIIGDHTITVGFETEPIFYFVHTYHFVPEDPSVIAGVCDYGSEVTALIEKENVFGAQFHPEKSHNDGLQILKNFLNISC